MRDAPKMAAHSKIFGKDEISGSFWLNYFSQLIVANHVAIIVTCFLICLFMNNCKLLARRTLTRACLIEAPRTCVALLLVKIVLYRVKFRRVC